MEPLHKKTQEMDLLQTLGKDIQGYLLQFLRKRDLRSLSQTAKYMHARVDHEWASRVRTEFGVTKHPNFDKDRSWRQIYLEHEYYCDTMSHTNYAYHGLIWGIRCGLRLGVDVNRGLETPLHAAAFWGYVDIVSLLIENGASIDQVSLNNDTPLNTACYHGRLDVAKFLLEKGADSTIPDEEGYLPIYSASLRHRNGVLDLFIKRGDDVNVVLPNGSWAPLHFASRYDAIECVDLLLQNGANPNTRGRDGSTPLHVATCFRVIELLLNAGADANAKDEDGWTALHHAASRGDKEIISLLLEFGADVGAENVHGYTPNDIACKFI